MNACEKLSKSIFGGPTYLLHTDLTSNYSHAPNRSKYELIPYRIHIQGNSAAPNSPNTGHEEVNYEKAAFKHIWLTTFRFNSTSYPLTRRQFSFLFS